MSEQIEQSLEVMGLKNLEKFNNKKDELKEFSEKIPKQSELPTVPQNEKMFGLVDIDYAVKGKDMNHLTEVIQDRMIEQNKNIKKIIQEFNTIYETFQILDDDYLKHISFSLNSAQAANQKALQGLKEIESYQNQNKELLNEVLNNEDTILKILNKHDSILQNFISQKNNQDYLQSQINKIEKNISDTSKYDELKLLITGYQSELKTVKAESAMLRKTMYIFIIFFVVLFILTLYWGIR
ncbi:hypothetical protein ACVRXQ_01570 [Streptococcus panodentis]|uniref:Rhoptry protein n=1 Tax=Streptococcus panodentis TaxID=1581472 RepID=A0ABS5AY07_9STRE|nr:MULTISPECIES: hypothetical protein [Streptococcus]KXT79642.1 Rhoptry protein [Streptococcus sp. DD11]MBP2621467.1 hypothetical protein [Streptococcus panodentis]